MTDLQKSLAKGNLEAAKRGLLRVISGELSVAEQHMILRAAIADMDIAIAKLGSDTPINQAVVKALLHGLEQYGAPADIYVDSGANCEMPPKLLAAKLLKDARGNITDCDQLEALLAVSRNQDT